MDRNVVLAVVVFLGLAAGGYYFISQRTVDKEVHEQVVNRSAVLQQKAEALESRVGMLEQELQKEEPAVDNETLRQVFGELPVSETREGAAVETVETRIMNFFRYIDGKGYLAEQGINRDAATYCKGLIDRLSRIQPVVTEETKDLYTLLKNITFFFRVLGEKDVVFIKAILAGEAEIIEPTMGLIFEWLDPWQGDAGAGQVAVKPGVFYEYAGYFLQTIAGQAYLFRRDSKVRCLATYYCVLVLDQANDHDINRYGIDIRPHIDALADEMRSRKDLHGRMDYLERLLEISGKY